MKYAQLSWLAEFIFPNFCCGCNRRPGVVICDSCSRHLAVYKKQTCFWCRRETPLGIMHQPCRLNNELILQGVFSIFWYAGMAGRVLRSAKYRFHNPTALDELCRLIPLSHRFDLFTLQRYIQAQAITYIPLSNASKRRRGFNQSEHIAQYLGAILNLPVCALVTKVTETPNQASLDKKARAQTRNHMFRASSKGLRSVYLVDDVITTGATMRAAAQALHNAGITSIYGITLCRS